MAYKSGKQRRAEIVQIRKLRVARKEQRLAGVKQENNMRLAIGKVAVDASALRPHNSYGLSFTLRGYYEDKPFRCVDCGEEGVWTAEQQKWWYEVIKGSVYALPARCSSCRKKERQRKEEARRVSEAGMARKLMGNQ